MTSGRKSKWDVPPEGFDSKINPANTSTLAAFNNFGTQTTSAFSSPNRNTETTPNTGIFEYDIPINNCGQEIRLYLTKNKSLNEIYQQTGATVVVRGVFIPSNETSSESPLHLHVVAPTMEALAKGITHINDYISQESNITETISLGLIDTLPSFDVLSHILGPKESYLNHIRTVTRTHVTLKGKGTNYDVSSPLYIELKSPSKDDLINAQNLCESLFQTVRTKYMTFLGSLTQPLPSVNSSQSFQNSHLSPEHSLQNIKLEQTAIVDSLAPPVDDTFSSVQTSSHHFVLIGTSTHKIQSFGQPEKTENQHIETEEQIRFCEKTYLSCCRVDSAANDEDRKRMPPPDFFPDPNLAFSDKPFATIVEIKHTVSNENASKNTLVKPFGFVEIKHTIQNENSEKEPLEQSTVSVPLSGLAALSEYNEEIEDDIEDDYEEFVKAIHGKL